MKISNENLSALKAKGIKVPEYNRKELSASIVHIGLGHFHRSHFLTYMDEMLGKGCWHGGVFEVDIIPSNPDFISALASQDYMYSVLSLAPDGTRKLRINGPVVGYANACSDPDTVLDKLTDPSVSLITLTITEKGYCCTDDGSSLDFTNSAIAHDLEEDSNPKSAIGWIAKALSERARQGNPVTVMSCDNMPENGKVLRECIMQFCKRKYPNELCWIESNVSFPCTMVDRITPGTTADDIRGLSQEYGIDDSCPVHCEEFMQWVIEDNSCTSIPDFSKAGALVVDDVKPYELMKIRLLNGSHSALSYPAYMMGITKVDEAMGNDLIRHFIRDCYMEELSATLLPVPGVDIAAYKDQLIERFSNPYISDTILRLASDGSKKIANAILRPLEEAMEKGLSTDCMVLALAMWEHYYSYRDANGSPMPIDDPLKDELLAAASDPAEFFRIAGLSEKVLSAGVFTDKVKSYLKVLEGEGVAAVLKSI